jgi:hypothetical protein
MQTQLYRNKDENRYIVKLQLCINKKFLTRNLTLAGEGRLDVSPVALLMAEAISSKSMKDINNLTATTTKICKEYKLVSCHFWCSDRWHGYFLVVKR